MTRKLLALLATTLLAFSLLPTTFALASAAGTAQLTTALTTFPRDNTTATVRVNNAEPPVVGKSVNYVDIILPAGTAGVVLDDAAITAPTGWTAKKDVSGTFQAVTFKTTGPGLAPGQNLSFSVPVDVTRPLDADRSGAFNVAISSNGGANTRAASAATPGALTMTVKILEMLNLAPTAPPGVTDSTATGGQEITMTYGVRNHAQRAVTVTSLLTSSDPTDLISPAPATTVPGDPSASTTISQNVLLGPAKTGDRTSTFSASGSSPGAATSQASRSITVQWEPDFNFNQLQPTRVRSGLGANYTFSANAAKSGTPALQDVTGTLTFAQTTTRLPAPTTFASGVNSKVVQFEQVEVAGNSGTYPPTMSLSGVDANGKTFSITEPVDPSITIDNLVPTIKNIVTGIPAGQTAVKDGDSLTVSGCLVGTGDIRLSSLRVVLDPNVGNDINVAVTTQAGSAGSECEYTFTGTASPQWETGATSVHAVAEVADTAGNIGGGQGPAVVIDQILPTLQNFGRIETTRTIRIQFLDDLTTAIEGGCDPGAYSAAGLPGSIEKITFQGETESCLGKPSDGTGVRIIWFREGFELDQDDRPQITYESNGLLNSDPAEDGARNRALRTVIDTVSGIRPAAPSIVSIERNNGTEAAYSESDAGDNVTNYFTRFPGTGDLATEDLLVTFGGARNNYLIQVLDGQGRVIASKTLTNPAIIGTSREFNSEVRVPIGGNDGTYRRGIRLVGNNNEGDISWFDVVLDTVRPEIEVQGLQSDGQTVVVHFGEPLVGGTDFANDWIALEETSGGPQWYRALDVVSTDADTRTITFPLQSPSDFSGAFYRLTSDGGIRYEDRGGNQMLDTLSS